MLTAGLSYNSITSFPCHPYTGILLYFGSIVIAESYVGLYKVDSCCQYSSVCTHSSLYHNSLLQHMHCTHMHVHKLVACTLCVWFSLPYGHADAYVMCMYVYELYRLPAHLCTCICTQTASQLQTMYIDCNISIYGIYIISTNISWAASVSPSLFAVT